MATLTINVPDAVAARVLNGFAKRFGYSSEIDGSPNPETKAQFCKRMLIIYIKQAVRDAEVKDAQDAAGTTASASVENEIMLS